MSNTSTQTRREWCFFCESVFDPDAHEKCPRVCDGGEHEGFPRDDDPRGVRRGFSLHTSWCPRSNPYIDLPATVPCMCTVAPGKTT